MSNCQNCFNGCTETISDQCVKYTGIDIPTLGISNGDPLSVIEQSLITFLVSALNGSGIKIDLSEIDICAVIQKYLPTCGEISIEDISKALIEAACDLQEQVNSIFASLTVLNSDYVIGCLTGVTASSDTHDIVQATIYKLCDVNSNVTSILNQLPLFVTKSELCDRIAECLTNNVADLASAKMLPYSPVPYYGDITGFDATGTGSGYWARVFMCNGQNSTPDLRGRVSVGATNTPSAFPCSTETIPNGSGNPTYNKGDLRGYNTTTLNATQIPSHSHANTISVILTDPKHTHQILGSTNTSGGTGAFVVNNVTNNGGPVTTDSKSTGITIASSITNAAFGGDSWHSNVQPGLALYYIMYIPA
jgi:microcystin-dependent protein